MRKKSSIASRRMQKLFSNKLAAVGMVVIVIMILMCACAPLLTSADPSKLDTAQKFLPPSAEHLLGTDQLGRDLFARILYGGRVSIAIGLVSAIAANMLGVVLGCIAGYFGGKADSLLLYLAEFFSCFPQTLVVMIVMCFLGQSVFWLITIFAVTGWMGTMRMVRSKILSLKQEPYVDSCRVNGIGGMSIMFRHMLPNALGVVIVNITLSISGYVLSEAGLSFLGLGVSPSIPTWGNMLNAAKNLTYMINNPLLWLVPGVAISLFVLGCNFFGDGLRDAMDVTQ